MKMSIEILEKDLKKHQESVRVGEMIISDAKKSIDDLTKAIETLKMQEKQGK